MGVLIDLRQVIDDEWDRVDHLAGRPANQPLLVTPRTLQSEADSQLSARRRIGVELAPAESVEAILPYLARIELIVLHFEVFADGRAFSQARLLRDRYRYRGRLRARGDVVRDLLSFMQRCGIDQFELAPGEDVALALSAFGEISRHYQPETDRRAG